MRQVEVVKDKNIRSQFFYFKGNIAVIFRWENFKDSHYKFNSQKSFKDNSNIDIFIIREDWKVKSSGLLDFADKNAVDHSKVPVSLQYLDGWGVRDEAILRIHK